jgi:hypothetical protein
MKKLLNISAIGLMLITSQSGFGKDSPLPFTNATYGVCGCGGNSSNRIIELKLNEDKSFVYKDNSDLSNKRELTGTWKTSGKKIVLQSHDNKTFTTNGSTMLTVNASNQDTC